MNFFVVTLAVLGILGMLGAALAFSWLCGQAAGRAVGWALSAPEAAQPEALSQRELQEMDELIRRTRQDAGLPPLQ